MRKSSLFVSSLATTSLGLFAFFVLEKSNALSTSDSSVAANWLVKDVCVDALNRPIAMDPYSACPSGSTRRKILPTDPIPYHNIEQLFYQQCDSYYLYDKSGNLVPVATFDYAPFNAFNLYGGSDGYDIYSIGSSFVGIASSRDGGGYGQQFIGAACSYGTAWLSFPTTKFLKGGSATSLIHNNYWEQSAQSYYGPCPTAFTYGTTQTYWAYFTNYAFGGINGNPVKTMDTMISYHGFCSNGCNMEVFWFTREYGKTMWQAWVYGTNATATNQCAISGAVTFKGQTFTVVDCHDWSAVTVATQPEIVAWPLPQANLLAHSHFDSSGSYSDACSTNYGTWCRSSTTINWSLLTSTSFASTSYGTHQVAYLATNCGGTCYPSSKFIYQDIPIASIVNGGTYMYGVDLRCESASGQFQIALQVIDNANNVVFQSNVSGTVLNSNSGISSQASSVYLSSMFLHKTAVVSWTSSTAVKLRFLMIPLTTETFDILDSFVNFFPTISGGFGSV